MAVWDVRDCRNLRCRAHGRYLRRIRRLALALAAERAESARLRAVLKQSTTTTATAAVTSAAEQMTKQTTSTTEETT